MDKSFFSQQKYTSPITEAHKCGSDNHCNFSFKAKGRAYHKGSCRVAEVKIHTSHL